MNFLILGDGDDEHGWAWAIHGHPEHQLRAAYPGFDDLGDVQRPADLDDALATSGVDAVLVGGDLSIRGEWLRRVAAEGVPAICLHPPGDDSEAYYLVAMSHAETGAVLVPDLPARLHPGVEALRRALDDDELGGFRGIRLEQQVQAGDGDGDLARHVFARSVDVIRALIGDVASLSATGDPPGTRPDRELVVQLRAFGGHRAEVRIAAGSDETARLTVAGDEGSLTLEYDPSFDAPARLTERSPSAEVVRDLESFDHHAAILDALTRAVQGDAAGPDLLDGTRAMELSEATVRSLRRGRTVDLHYEQISEAANFKSVMTSTGCMLFLATLVILPVALAGPALGLRWLLYLAYAIPPALVLFILLQFFRFAAREARHPRRGPGGPHPEETAISTDPS